MTQFPHYTHTETQYWLRGEGVHSQAVAGAFLLTPHLPSAEMHWRTPGNMPGRLFHPEYNSIFRFGAITLRPGMSLDSIADVMEKALSDSGVDLR